MATVIHDPPGASTPGETFGDFEVLEKLGQGGMARVHRALWRPRGVEVALKRLHPDLGEPAVRRFLREIQIVSRLRHDAIVPLLDHGQVDDTPYYAMALVRGTTLHAQIQARRVQGKAISSVEEFYDIAGGLASALAYLHREKVLHRDLKPSNIFVSEDGRPLLADFGLSRMEELTRMTNTGDLLGTPGYMAPEQFDGVVARETIDVYQMGLVLYELLTGKLPFAELRDYRAIVYARTTRRIAPPSQLNPLVTPAMDRLVMRCLSPAAEDRYADGGALEAALRGCREGKIEAPIPERPISRVSSAAGPGAARKGSDDLSLRWGVVVAGGCLLGLAAAVPMALSMREGAGTAAGASEAADGASDADADGIFELSLEPRRQEAVISFRTRDPVRSSVLLEGPEGPSRRPVSGEPSTRHSAWIAGLEAGTAYRYRLLVEDEAGRKQATAPQRFETAR